MSNIKNYLNGYSFDEVFTNALDILTNSNNIRKKIRIIKESNYLNVVAILELNEICKKCFSIICKTIYELHGFDIKNKEQFIDKNKESVICIDSFNFKIHDTTVSVHSSNHFGYNVDMSYFELFNHYFTEDFHIEYLYMNEEEITKNVSRIFYESKINKEKNTIQKYEFEQNQKIIRQNALNKLTEQEKSILGL